jgi:CRP-like cAMP-binding protein
MALDTDISILAGAPLFSLLDRQPLRLLAFAAETLTGPEGGVLFRKGDPSDGGYVVTHGAVALDAEDGTPVFVAEPGAVIGPMALFIATTRGATATVRAPDSAVLRVAPTLMKRVLREFPAAAAALHEVLAAEVLTLRDGLERLRDRFAEPGGAEDASMPHPADAAGPIKAWG